MTRLGTSQIPADTDAADRADERQAAHETNQQPVGKPGGFDNDPPDASNPNEVIERHRQKLRP